MNKNLIIVLCEKNIINDKSIIECYYTARIMGGFSTSKMLGEFHFTALNNDKLKLRKVNTNEYISVSADDILTIDGMAPDRLAGIYGIKPDGSKKKQKIDPITGLPVRRGRKTNKVKEIINERLNQLGKRNTIKERSRASAN